MITAANKKYFLRCSEDSQLRNKFLRKVLTEIDETKKSILANSKVICFSENHLSTLMWSHYAHYHEGFTLAYSKDDLKNANVYDSDDNIMTTPLRLGAVRYQAQMPDCGEFFYEYFPQKLMGRPHYDYTGFLCN